MPMPFRCANCGGYITQQELDLRKPPVHPWRLTANGARVAAENETRGGDNPQCTECGNRTLVRPG
jgi:DNA-directed RNA polymerase subunit RPC12/RpoP